MTKSGLGLGDFTIASKRVAQPDDAVGVVEPVVGNTGSEESGDALEDIPANSSMLQNQPRAERDKRARERAIMQEDARYSIKNLKRAKQRQVKFFVNVALDQATKARLKRAADENDIKMAAVMKAAIDFYLKENGY